MTETDENADGKHIVQLIPADGWVAFYKDDDETAQIRSPLVAWGLQRDGEVVPLDTGPEGDVGDPREASNFDRIEQVNNERFR